MVRNLRGRTYEERLEEVGMVTLETIRLRGDKLQTFRIVSGIDLVPNEQPGGQRWGSWHQYC